MGKRVLDHLQGILWRGLAMIALAVICGSVAAFSPVFAQPAAPSAKRLIRYSDLPAELSDWLAGQGINRANFDARIAAIERETAQRERQGELDHLIFFLLQSTRFTDQPKIEPALSADQFVKALNQAERPKYLAAETDFIPPIERMSASARARLKDFIKTLNGRATDERLTYFKKLLSREADFGKSLEQFLYTEYARSMRFLYEKEFASRAVKKEDLAAYVASLYQQRGYSTDTQIEANFAVSIALGALSALKAETPGARINRVLIVGPGLDFAPRTDLLELFGPQSYQPFAVADALLSLKLAEAERLQIHCIDINERVVGYLSEIGRRQELRLSILSGVSESAARPLTDEFKSYFRELGRAIGEETPLDVPPGWSSHLRKGLKVRPEVVKRISVDRLNLITERYEPSPNYDLVIVTNVFPYFSQVELLFALANISQMMAEGGYLIHNELQTVPQAFVAPLRLPLQQARTVLIAFGGDFPLYDGVAVHQKKSRTEK